MGQENVAALKQQLKDMMSQRDAIESEVNQLTTRLDAPGMPGLKGSVLDKEGYPRADIDIAAVRADRQRLSCLTNDHKAVTASMDKLLQKLHAAARTNQGSPAPPDLAPAPSTSTTSTSNPNASGSSGQVPASAATSSMEVDGAPSSSLQQLLIPFAVVDEVSDGSPAQAAGIQVGDQLCRFGEVESSGSGDELQRVAQVLGASEGCEVAAVVLRGGAPLALGLTPQRWPGRGLLGCHLRPFKS